MTGQTKIVMGNVAYYKKQIEEQNERIKSLEKEVSFLLAKLDKPDPKPMKKPVRSQVYKDDVCFECGKPHSQCDPEGVGHYRG